MTAVNEEGTSSGGAGWQAALAARLEAELGPGRVELDAPMRLHTSFAIGGPADILVTVDDLRRLESVLEGCRRFGVGFLVLGRGTNLLVRDGGIRGVVVRLAGQFLETRFRGATVEAGAGAPLAALARDCGRRGLAGLEFAVGIPGAVGGAVVMNAGAYGREMKDVVEAATVLKPAAARGAAAASGAAPEGLSSAGPFAGAAPEEVAAARLGFGYRTSLAQREGWIVLSARFGLTPGDREAIHRAEADYDARRKAIQPGDLPSAGSVFKRPPGGYAGTLIEESGCKGLRVGDAQVSEKHAGFIVNLGSATARNVLDLAELVRRRVHERTGVWLEPEVRVVGDDGPRPA